MLLKNIQSCDLLSWCLYRGRGGGDGFLLQNSVSYSTFVPARTGWRGISQMWTYVDKGGEGSKITENVRTSFMDVPLCELITTWLKQIFRNIKHAVKNWKLYLSILIGQKHLQRKLQHLQKVWIWIFGQLVQQINSLYEFLKQKQNFQKKLLLAKLRSSW